MSVETNFQPYLAEKNRVKSILAPSIEQTTLYPDELQHVLSRIPTIQEARKIRTEKVQNVVKEKPFAMDLADEVRKIRAMKILGEDPEQYWDFFKAQAEYYANESYAKLGVIAYEHQLVNDHGNLCLWIDPMGKSAKESYEEAGMKGGPQWYRDRCDKETAQIDSWEAQLQMYGSNNVLMDISPAPFDVPEEELEGTMFGNHSFVRLHQLVYDEHGTPYVYSQAHRTYLPPSRLEAVMNMYTGHDIPAQELLGTIIPLAEGIDIKDLRDNTAGIQLQAVLNTLWEETPIGERPMTEEDTAITYDQMQSHYKVLEPELRAVFEEMLQDKNYSELEAVFLQRLVKTFQNWEKKVKGKVSGEWDAQVAEITQLFIDHPYTDEDIMQRVHLYFNQQEYRAETNACGNGSGASIGMSEASVLSGSTSVYSGIMGYGEMSAIFGDSSKSQSEKVCVKCPHCNNEKGNLRVKNRYICGNKKCLSNKR